MLDRLQKLVRTPAAAILSRRRRGPTARVTRPVTVALAGISFVALGLGGTAAAKGSGLPASTDLGFSTSVTTTSGLNSEGVPGGLGRRGTLHATLHPVGRPHGETQGQVELELQVTSVTFPSKLVFTGAVELPAGTFDVQGVQAENQQQGTLAVTGGTGRYVGASGTATLGGDGTLRIHLLRN